MPSELKKFRLTADFSFKVLKEYGLRPLSLQKRQTSTKKESKNSDSLLTVIQSKKFYFASEDSSAFSIFMVNSSFFESKSI